MQKKIAKLVRFHCNYPYIIAVVDSCGEPTQAIRNQVQTIKTHVELPRTKKKELRRISRFTPCASEWPAGLMQSTYFAGATMGITHVDMILRIAIGAALGGTIGLERDRHGRQAGLRTHLIVAMASATFMVVSAHFQFFQNYGNVPGLSTDPSRIAASVVTGIGFLAGGAILKTGNDDAILHIEEAAGGHRDQIGDIQGRRAA